MLIHEARAIRTGDAADYAWKDLRRFQNVTFVEREIVRLHELDKRWHQAAQKQAAQLRYCLTQAREYFEAAAAVSLATKPTLLYYSIMSLALAEILMKQSGMSSLDKAREQHRHHGLLFKHQPKPAVRSKPLADAAAELVATPMESPNGERKGTFELWHQSCREMPLAGVLREHLPNGTSSGFRILMSSEDDPLDPVPTKGLSLYDCLAALPGMAEYVGAQGVASRTLRAGLTVDVYKNTQQPHDIIKLIVHPSPLAADFIANIKIYPGDFNRVNLVDFPSGGLITLRNEENSEPVRFVVPDGTTWTQNEIRFWTERQPLNEFGYLYVALFIAGNYARYYPDLWLLDVEACNPLALAIEQLMSLAEQRMAWLTLSELSRVYFVVE